MQTVWRQSAEVNLANSFTTQNSAWYNYEDIDALQPDGSDLREQTKYYVNTV